MKKGHALIRYFSMTRSSRDMGKMMRMKKPQSGEILIE
jgi:hypothetical protein